MPLWVGDFLAKTQDLDAKEIGAYMLLLMAMWSRDGYLPDDEKKLQRVARCGRDWGRIWGGISHYFTAENGQITQPRLLEELQKVASKRAVNAQSGARGGRAKALKTKERDLANATVSLKQSEPYPEREEKRDTNVSPKKPKPEQFQEFWDQYPHRGGAKKGRAKVEKIYARIVGSGVSEQILIGAAMRYATDRQVLDGFGKGPEPWLNQEGWKDDIEPPRTAPRADHSRQSGTHDSLFAGFGQVAADDDRQRASGSADDFRTDYPGDTEMDFGPRRDDAGAVFYLANAGRNYG